jgi:hypothetical protein
VNQVTRPRGRHAVFVDPSGKRRRLVVWAGITAGCVLAAYLAIVAFGLVTGSGAPLTPWPQAKSQHGEAAPNGVSSQPRPRSSAGERATASASPSGEAPTSTRDANPAHPATTAPSTAHPAKGRGRGLSKSPHPRRT